MRLARHHESMRTPGSGRKINDDHADLMERSSDDRDQPPVRGFRIQRIGARPHATHKGKGPTPCAASLKMRDVFMVECGLGTNPNTSDLYQ